MRPTLHRWMGEIARVLNGGGVLLYSDFHPEAARAGLTRSFKDAHNRSSHGAALLHGLT